MKNYGAVEVHNVKRRRQMADMLGKHLNENKAFEAPVADLTHHDEENPPEPIGIVVTPGAMGTDIGWVSDKFEMMRFGTDNDFVFKTAIASLPMDLYFFSKKNVGRGSEEVILQSADRYFAPILRNFQSTINKNSLQQLELVQAMSVVLEAYIQIQDHPSGTVDAFTTWAANSHESDTRTTPLAKTLITLITSYLGPTDREKAKKSFRLILGVLNVVLAKLLRSGLSWSFDDTDAIYRENIESIQQVKSNLEFLKKSTIDAVKAINAFGIPAISADAVEAAKKTKESLEVLLQTVLNETLALLDRDRRISDVERENTALKRDLYIQRSRQNAVIGARKEAYEMLLRQETMLFLEAMDIPSYRFATLVAGYLTMMYYNSVLKIDYFTYIISRSKDSNDTVLFDDIMMDPLTARKEMDDELQSYSTMVKDIGEAANLMEWFDANGGSSIKSKYLKLRYFIYTELKVFYPLYSQDKADTHTYGHLMLTPMIISARTTAWNLIQNLLQEAKAKNSAGFAKYGGNCEKSMNWIFTYRDEKVVRLMGLMARLTATKYTEFQLTKGHTTQNDKVERIVITESLELEIRKCLQEMGFAVASNAFTASFLPR